LLNVLPLTRLAKVNQHAARHLTAISAMNALTGMGESIAKAGIALPELSIAPASGGRSHQRTCMCRARTHQAPVVDKKRETKHVYKDK
jgi:hypothetical protein